MRPYSFYFLPRRPLLLPAPPIMPGASARAGRLAPMRQAINRVMTYHENPAARREGDEEMNEKYGVRRISEKYNQSRKCGSWVDTPEYMVADGATEGTFQGTRAEARALCQELNEAPGVLRHGECSVWYRVAPIGSCDPGGIY